MPHPIARAGNFSCFLWISFSAVLFPPAACYSTGRADDAKKVDGVWQGVALKNGAVHRFVTLQIHPDLNEKFIGALTIDGARHDLDKGRVNASDLALQLKGEFGGQTVFLDCKLDGDKQRLVGEWRVGAEKLPLVLGRSGYLYMLATPTTATTSTTAAKPVVAATTSVSNRKRERPLNVILPYEQRPVVFSNRKAKIDFGAVISVPWGNGPFPAILLIGGAGPHDADIGYGEHYRPYMDLADHLTRLGFAVLRVNTRGVLGSGGGHYYLATLSDLAEDALSAIDFLEGVPKIDSKRIGVLGWSGGGLVASIAASRRPQTAFVVMMGTPFTDGERYYEAACLGSEKTDSAGSSEKTWFKTLQRIFFSPVNSESKLWETYYKPLYAVAKNEKDPVLRRARLREVVRKWLSEQGYQPADADLIDTYIPQVVETPWLRDFLVHDPIAVVRNVKCPMLAIFGTEDQNVTAKAHVPHAMKVLREAGNPASELVELRSLGHSFLERPSANDDSGSYASISPVLMERVSTWLKRVVLRDPPTPAKAAAIPSTK